MTNQVISAVKGTARVIGETYRLGFKAWIAAPLLVALAVLPQLLQHAIDIRRGMFWSLEQYRFLAALPGYQTFAYLKVAGIVIALLAIARFWAVGSVRKVFVMPLVDLARLLVSITLLVAVAWLFAWLTARHLPPLVAGSLRVVSLLVQAGLALFVAAALFQDRALTLRAIFTQRWPTILLLALALLIAFLPAQLLHMFDHRIAIGRPSAIVVALMTWDSLVVGLIASLAGSALWAAYRSGATWDGWVPGFMPEPKMEREAVAAEASVKPAVVVAPPAPAPSPAPVVEPAPEAPSRRRRPRPGPRRRG